MTSEPLLPDADLVRRCAGDRRRRRRRASRRSAARLRQSAGRGCAALRRGAGDRRRLASTCSTAPSASPTRRSRPRPRSWPGTPKAACRRIRDRAGPADRRPDGDARRGAVIATPAFTPALLQPTSQLPQQPSWTEARCRLDGETDLEAFSDAYHLGWNNTGNRVPTKTWLTAPARLVALPRDLRWRAGRPRRSSRWRTATPTFKDSAVDPK